MPPTREPAGSNRLKATNSTRSSVLAERVKVADTSITRFIGLLGRRSISSGEGLLIQPSNGVHTVGMQFSIDVLLLDRSGIVLAAYHTLRPFRVTRINWKAASALELPAGVIAASQTQVGDQLNFEPN